LLDLSQQQKAAVQYIKGPLLVLGGAGTGKTSLLAHKIAWLIREYDAPPARVIVIANNANQARLMRSRVADLLGRHIPELRVATFSEVGLGLIQQRLDALSLLPGFSLYDRLDSETLTTRLLRETRPDLIGLANAVSRQIARWKRALITPPIEREMGGSTVAEISAWLYRRYEQRLRSANAIDIEDLVRKAVRLLTTDATLLTEWRSSSSFLLVDEYERIEAGEHELVRLLIADGPVLTAVGDESQSRGESDGHADNLARLRTEHAGLRVMHLDRNFRSTGRIARSAARLGGSRRPVDAPQGYKRESGARLRVLQTRSKQHEADSVVAALLAHKAHVGCEYRDYAILLPRVQFAPLIERALQARRIPYCSHGGASLSDQPEVRDLRAYLKLLCNPSDDIAFLRAVNTPRRDIDRSTLEQLMNFAAGRGRPLLETTLDPELAQGLTPGRLTVLHNFALLMRTLGERASHTTAVQLLYDLILELRYDEWLRDTCNDVKIADRRMQSVVEFIGWLRRMAKQRPEADLRALVTQLSLNAALDPDEYETTTEGVVMMPIAIAKGLEFAHVYVVGIEDGWWPDVTENDLDRHEARWLSYVAIGCARESVTFSLTEHRRASGDAAIHPTSSLLEELAPEDVEWSNSAAEPAAAEAVLGHTILPTDRISPRRYG
jgi:ATP-dependent DNA helicase Rep